MHKPRNVLNYLPKRTQPKAEKMLHNIWQAETREDAHDAFDLFVKAFEAEYPKATECLIHWLTGHCVALSREARIVRNC